MVYIAHNLVTGKYYIGQTIDFAARRAKHESEANLGSKFYFHSALRKYGKGAFKWDVLSDVNDVDSMNSQEKLFIWAFQSNNSNYGYNMAIGGTNGAMLGRKHTAESKQKMSLALKGRQFSEEAKRKMSLSQRGKNAGTKNPMFGTKMSDEHKKLLLSYSLGSHLTEEHKLKLKKAMTGRFVSAETRKKMSLASSGSNNGMFGKIPWNKGKKKQKLLGIQ